MFLFWGGGGGPIMFVSFSDMCHILLPKEDDVNSGVMNNK